MKTTTNIILASLVAAGTSHATLIAGVTVESVSGENGGFNRLAINTLNQSGFTLTAPGEVGGVHVSDPGGTMWMESNGDPTTADITYNLGSTYTLDSFRVWNYNEGYNNGGFVLTDRGFQDVTITYGATAALGSTLTSVTKFAQASGLNGYTGEEFTFAPISAQYFKIESSSNYGGAETGLSEIQFNEAVVAVPEPSSAALLGLGGIALLLRRRK